MILQRLLILALTLSEAGYMAFDGTRGLAVGSLMTPGSGAYAGQLGPWRFVVAAVGVDPAGRGMRWVFAVYGWAWIAIAAAFLSRQPWAWTAMLVAACGALWYLPVGTLLSIVQIALLLAWRTRLHQT